MVKKFVSLEKRKSESTWACLYKKKKKKANNHNSVISEEKKLENTVIESFSSFLKVQVLPQGLIVPRQP